MNSTITTKRKILFFIPLGIVVITLLYSWFTFIMTGNVAVFQHYLGLLLFIPVIYFLFRDKTFKKTIVLLGIYLLLTTINLISFFPFIITNQFGISIASFMIWTPKLNGFGLLILIFYAVLNWNTLIDIYLDYKEAKGQL